MPTALVQKRREEKNREEKRREEKSGEDERRGVYHAIDHPAAGTIPTALVHGDACPRS
jgi:hypothetical protein